MKTKNVLRADQKIMRNTRLPLSLALLAMSCVAHSQFTDQGFKQPYVNGDFQDPTYGSASNPLVLTPCVFDPNPYCYSALTNAFATTNVFRNYVGPAITTPWNLHYNNEQWETQDYGVPGQSIMPNQNLAYSTLGFAAINQSQVGESHYRAHLSINHLVGQIHPEGFDAAPHMSIGEFAKRTGRAPGALNNPLKPSKVSFTQRIWEAKGDRATSASVAFLELYAFAEWGGKQHAVFITLFDRNYFAHTLSPQSPGIRAAWEWPIQGSMFHPGANLAYFPAFGEGTSCPGAVEGVSFADNRSDHRFVVDLQRAFECASARNLFPTPMPTNQEVPITIVGWDNEGTRANTFLWSSVHDMKMHKAGDVIPLAGVFPGKADGAFVTQQRQIVQGLCGDRCENLIGQGSPRIPTNLTVEIPAALSQPTVLRAQINTPYSIGKVQFRDEFSSCTAPVIGGSAQCLFSPQGQGARQITVTYSGNASLDGAEIMQNVIYSVPADAALRYETSVDVTCLTKPCDGAFYRSHTFKIEREVAAALAQEADDGSIDLATLVIDNVSSPLGLSTPANWRCRVIDAMNKINCKISKLKLSDSNAIRFRTFHTQTTPTRIGAAELTGIIDPNLSNNRVNNILF